MSTDIVRLELSEKEDRSIRTWRYNTRKIELPCLEKTWLLNSLKIPWYFVFSFLFRTNGKKEHLDEKDFLHWYGNFSKVLFWKLLDHSYVSRSFSTIARHIANSILKNTQQLKILSWINMHPVFSWTNFMKRKSTKTAGKKKMAFHLFSYAYFFL